MRSTCGVTGRCCQAFFTPALAHVIRPRAAPHAPSDTPKYLNSPRTPLFDKGALLFGLYEQQDLHTAGAVPVSGGALRRLAVDLANTEQGPALAAVGVLRHRAHRSAGPALARFNEQRVLMAFDVEPAGQRPVQRPTG